VAETLALKLVDLNLIWRSRTLLQCAHI